MAKGLGIPYRTAYRRLQKYGIQYGRQNKGGRPPNVLHPGYEGGRLFLSQAIKELVGMSSFDRIPASRLKALRLDHVVDGAFSLEEKGEPHYFAASIIAQVVKQDPATQHLFAPYVSISGLIDMYTPHSLLPPDAMKDRVAYLQRQGVTSVKNNMLPLAQVDLVLTDLFQLECGTPVSYGNNIIDLPPVEEGVVREGTLPEGGAVEKVRLPQF